MSASYIDEERTFWFFDFRRYVIMKKYLMKFAALSVAALVSLSMLAACGEQTDETVSPDSAQSTQKEETVKPQEESAESEPAEADNTDAE